MLRLQYFSSCFEYLHTYVLILKAYALKMGKGIVLL